MSVSFNVTGKLVRKEDEVIISDNFKKRNFFLDITLNPQYNEVICFDLINDKTSLIEEYSEGDVIVVHFNIKCREAKKENLKGRYFTVLQAWKINKYNGETTSENNMDTENNDLLHEEENKTDEEDDLPF